MDFSEIGVKSRKTGLTAKDNVRRDENDMEDVDDFFKDDPTISINNNNNSNDNNNNDNSRDANRRIIFPQTNQIPSPPTSTTIRNSPLRSPLQSRHIPDIIQDPYAQQDDINEEFADALEDPPLENDYNNPESESMDIDDESKGTIRIINDQVYDDSRDFDLEIQEDLEKVPISPTITTTAPTTTRPSNSSQLSQPTSKKQDRTNKGQKLFVSSDDDYSREIDSNNLDQRQAETMRTTNIARAVLNQSSNLSTPRNLQKTSPLRSIKLNSPLKPSVASISRNLDFNKPDNTDTSSVSRPKKTPSPPIYIEDDEDTGRDDSLESSASEYNAGDDDVEEEYDDEAEDQDSQSNDSTPDETIQPPEDEPDGSFTVRDPRKRPAYAYHSEDEDDSIIANPRGRATSRVNKFARSNNTSSSPSSNRHVIDVDELKQLSRSSSKVKETQPTRRSSRVRIPRLAFWRNEKAIYEKSRGDVVPTLKKIITVDENITPLKSRAPSRLASRATSTSRKRTNPTRNRSPSNPRKPTQYTEQIIEEVNEDESDEALSEDELVITNGDAKGSEWLKTGFLKIDTFEGHGSDSKSNRLIAWAPGTESFSTSVISSTDNFKLAILFDKNREFIATGMMLIPPGGVKSLKSTDTTYFVFYCVSGIVEVTLSGTVFMIKKGCSLEVPMGNFYQFVNKGKKDATLFFVQTRGHEPDDWDAE